MTVLADYSHFDGRHWETGSIHNFMAYRGFNAPHTGEPYSEGLLLGISGGAVIGYFTFAYEGYDPQARILTRNTFDPLDTLLSRLGVEQSILRTGSAKKGRENLVQTLEEGVPAVVWADMFSLPYNAPAGGEGMWAMFPIVVFGYQPGETVFISDRARVPLSVTPEQLAVARGRVKKDKHQLLTIGPPNEDKLADAVAGGIRDCIALFTEKPPKGARHNFGFAAYEYWAQQLVAASGRASWAKVFPPGAELYAGLSSAFYDINVFGKGGIADRERYARFLDEAARILQKPGLHDAAADFRRAIPAWEALSDALLPEEVPLFAETAELTLRRKRLFLEQGNDALAEMQAIDARLAALREEAARDFPLSDGEAAVLRERIAERVMGVHDAEREAVNALQEAMGM